MKVSLAVAACVLITTPVIASSQSATQLARWGLQETVRIGAIDGRDALSSVRAITVGPDDAVYIAEGLVARIRVYTRDGRLLRSFGGRGGGPAEFESVDALTWLGDTLAVEDRVLQRVSKLTSHGGPLDTFRPASAGPFLTLGVFSDGSTLVRPQSTEYAREGGPPMPLLRLSRNASGQFGGIDTVAYRRAAGSGACAGDRIIVCLRTAIGTADILHVDPHGRFLTVAANLAASGPALRSFRVSRITSRGDTLMRTEVSYTPVAVSGQYRDSIADYWVSWLTNPPGGRPALSRAEALAVARDGLQVPAYFPPVYGVVTSRTGETWLHMHPRSGNRWIVLDAAGRRKADVIGGPDGFRLMYADVDTVWGTVTDALDVQYVVGLSIRR
jgi:hypothetical protein